MVDGTPTDEKREIVSGELTDEKWDDMQNE